MAHLKWDSDVGHAGGDGRRRALRSGSHIFWTLKTIGAIGGGDGAWVFGLQGLDVLK